MEVKTRHYLSVISEDFKSIPQHLSDTLTHQICLRGVITLLTAICLGYYWQLPFPYWIAISVFVSINSDIGAQVKKVVERCSAAFLGCWIGYLLASFIVNLPVFWSNLIIFGTAVTCSYLSSQAHNMAYFWMYTGLHIPLIMLLAANHPIPSVISIVAYRPLDITIGAMTCIPFALIMFFQSTTTQYQKTYQQYSTELQDWLDHVICQIQNEDYQFESTLETYVKLREQAISLKKQLLVCCFQKWNWFLYLKRWRAEIDVVLEVMQRLWNFYRVQMRLQKGRLTAQDKQYLNEFMHYFAPLILKYIGQKQPQLDCSEIDRQIHDSISQLRAGSPLKMLLPKMQQAWSHLTALQTNPNQPSPLNTHRSQFISWQPSHMRHAIKQGLSLLIVAWLTVILQIPGGTLNMALAIITVMQLDLFSTYHRGAQRFLGCLLGIALGAIVIFILKPATLVGLLVWVGLITYCLFFLIFVCQGGQYLAIQAGVAFLIVAVGPQITIASFASGFERAIGVLLGVIVAWAVNRTIWPDSYQQRLIAEIDVMAQQLAQLAHNTKRWLDQGDQTILQTPLLNYSNLHDLINQPSIQESITQDFKTQLLIRARITGEIYYCLPYCIRLIHHTPKLKPLWHDWLNHFSQLLNNIDKPDITQKHLPYLHSQLPQPDSNEDSQHLQHMAQHLLVLVDNLPKRSELIGQISVLSQSYVNSPVE